MLSTFEEREGRLKSIEGDAAEQRPKNQNRKSRRGVGCRIFCNEAVDESESAEREREWRVGICEERNRGTEEEPGRGDEAK